MKSYMVILRGNRSVYRILVETPEGESPLERLRRRRQENIKTLFEIQYYRVVYFSQRIKPTRYTLYKYQNY